jgi:hypothetical protein
VTVHGRSSAALIAPEDLERLEETLEIMIWIRGVLVAALPPAGPSPQRADARQYTERADYAPDHSQDLVPARKTEGLSTAIA